MENNNLKISVIITTFNEGKRLYKTINSLIKQSYLPDEIIISEGGSLEETKKILNIFFTKFKKISIINRTKKCRGAGRNIGIETANNPFVALIDAGNIASRNWLFNFKKIIEKDQKIKIIYGSIVPIRNNFFSRNASNVIAGKNIKNYKLSNSVSSLFINKKVWKDVKGFPESIDGSYVVEDLRFLNNIQNKKYKSAYSINSKVYWSMPTNINKFISRFKEYSCGAIENGYFKTWHLPMFKNYSILIFIFFISFYLNFLIFFIIFFLLIYRPFLYLKGFNSYKKISLKFLYDLFFSSYLLLIIDYATMLGFFNFLKRRLNFNHKRI